METTKKDIPFISYVNLITPNVGDVWLEEDGTKWRVVGRTLRWDGKLIVHTEKIEDNGN